MSIDDWIEKEFILTPCTEIKSILIKQIFTLIEGYIENDLIFLTLDGHWEKKPTNFLSRISSEFWYQINKLKNNDLDKIDEILDPFIESIENRKTTFRIWKAIGESKNSKFGLLSLVEIIYRLIAHRVDEIIADKFYPDWDFQSLKWQNQYIKRMVKFNKNIENFFCTEEDYDKFLKIYNKILFNDGGILSGILQVMVHEESVFEDSNPVFFSNEKQKKSYFVKFESKYYSVLSEGYKFPDALFRICLKLLSESNYGISSGIHYNAVNLLAVLIDKRSEETLYRFLQKTGRKYTLLRSNTIYVLGKLHCSKVIPYLEKIITGPEKFRDRKNGNNVTLSWEKQEALWAMGKMENLSLNVRRYLLKNKKKFGKMFRASFAWSLGKCGRAQLERDGCVEADIVSSLFELLNDSDIEVFEEAAFALKGLHLYEMLHFLSFRNFSTAPVLTMKPLRTGIVEITRTLDMLLAEKKLVVMAVTGDSGTGKTYFCDAILQGHARLEPRDILYLGRDDAESLKTLNRILGINYLKKNVNSEFYIDYPAGLVENDDPESFFFQFIKSLKSKKLVLLDGWQDMGYFDQVIKIFYNYGYLDILIKFHTNISTRRSNLEEREKILSNVDSCIACSEDLAIKLNSYFNDGSVIIYNLDNSISSRLTCEEISIAFQGPHVSDWATYVRPGEFNVKKVPLKIQTYKVTKDFFTSIDEQCESMQAKCYKFIAKETTFQRDFNEERRLSPCFLQEIRRDQLRFCKIIYSAMGQIAFATLDGDLGILSGLNDRIQHVTVHESKPSGFAILSNTLCSLDSSGNLNLTSFLDFTISKYFPERSRFTCIASDRNKNLVLGDNEGYVHVIMVTPFEKHFRYKVHDGPVNAVLVNGRGDIVSSGSDGFICRRSGIDSGIQRIFIFNRVFKSLEKYLYGSVVAMNSDMICIILNSKILQIPAENGEPFETVHCCADGRIIAGIKGNFNQQGIINIIDPGSGRETRQELPGHELNTMGCLTMGPRIITCGQNCEEESSIRIWGTETFIQKELEKMKLISKMKTRPSFWRSQL